MSGRSLAAFVLGGVAALAAMGVGALVVIGTGAFDTRASTPHSPLVAWATHTTMIHAVRRAAASVDAPPSFTAAEVRAGLRDYDQSCAACHGGPATERAAWVSGMTPSPPYLVDASRRWTPAELYWIVKTGVKMTGMPAWGFTRSDGQIWDLVAFLEALPDLPPRTYLRLRASQAAARPDAAAAVANPPAP